MYTSDCEATSESNVTIEFSRWQNQLQLNISETDDGLQPEAAEGLPSPQTGDRKSGHLQLHGSDNLQALVLDSAEQHCGEEDQPSSQPPQ